MQFETFFYGHQILHTLNYNTIHQVAIENVDRSSCIALNLIYLLGRHENISSDVLRPFEWATKFFTS